MQHRGKKQKIAWHDLDENELTIDDVRDNVDQILLRDTIEQLLGSLTTRESTVLRYRLFDDLTFQESGKRIGISRERIRQIELKALRKMRHPNRSLILEEFLTGIDIGTLRRVREQRLIQEMKSQALAYKKIQKDFEEECKRNEERWAKELQERNKHQRALGSHAYEINLVSVPVIVERIPEKRASKYCPSSVVLARHPNGIPYLTVIHRWDSIERSRDPETYDRWLNQLLDEEKSALSGAHQQEKTNEKLNEGSGQ